MRKLKDEENLSYGTKVFDFNKKAVALIIKTWDNTFWENDGKKIDIRFATCVDIEGKRYNTEFKNLTPLENLSIGRQVELGILKPKGTENGNNI